MKLFCITTLCFISLIGYSQKRIEEKESIEIIREGVKFHNDKKFEDAIELYSKVSINDTNYTTAQYETALSYFSMEKYPKAQEVLENLIELNLLYDYQNEIYSLLGSAYDEDGQLDKSIEVFNKALNLFPKSYLLLYNRALVYLKMNKHDKAIEDFQSAIECKADHVGSHYQLAIYAMNEGHYVEAMLGFMTYLMIDPTSDRANLVLGMLENMSNGEFEEKSKGFEWKQLEDYEQLNVLFKNKVALEDKYKVKLTIQTSYAKQFHFILENIKYEKDNPGFWNQSYLPFLLEFKEDHFDDMILYSLQSTSSEKISSKLVSKKARINDFIKVAQVKWSEHLNHKYAFFEGKKAHVYIAYQDSEIKSIGKVNEKDEEIGVWYYYHPNGALKMISHFDGNGKLNGVTERYNMYNGKLSSKTTFVDGKKNGVASTYYLYGELKERKTFKNDLLEDTLFVYYRSGDLLEKMKYVNDLKNGEIIGYHENSKINFRYSFVNDTANGVYNSYHPNGKKSLEFNLKNQLYDGLYVSYYSNGNKKESINYKNGLKEGIYEEWYSNGKSKSKSVYKSDVNIGEFTEWFSNGAKSYSGVLDESGKQNGSTINYDLDGLKYIEHLYKKGELIEVICYNKKGETTLHSRKKGKKLEYKINYPDGGIKSEGLYENDQRQGLWKFYNRYSNLSSIEFYKDGKLTDTTKRYYSNGQLKEIEVYKDGESNGLYLYYNIHGAIIQEGILKAGKWDKDFYEYNSNGTLLKENYYVNGELHGIQKYYAVNAKLKSLEYFEYGRLIDDNYYDTLGNVIDHFGEMNGKVELHDFTNSFIHFTSSYKNGFCDGETIWYGPNKKIVSKGLYINNKREGVWKHYDSMNQLIKEESYVSGLLEGEFKQFDEMGRLESIATYLEDNLEGASIFYYPNGKKEVEHNYVENDRHGKSINYGEDGDIYCIRYYDRGIFKAYSYLGNDGKEIEKIELKPGNNLITTYYTNGKKGCEYNRKNGLIEGHYVIYYKNGQKYSDEEFKNGNYHGKSLFYSPSGTIIKELNFKYDELNGKAFEYFENGKLKKSTNYIDGNKHGIEEEYSMEGKLIKTNQYYNNELIKITVHK